MSMIESSLVDWIASPDVERGGSFTDDGETWKYFHYGEFAAAARRFATALSESGVGVGQIVPIVLPAGADFIAAFFGSLLVGAAPAPIAPPMVFQSSDAYRRHLRKLLAICDASVLVTDRRLLSQISVDDYPAKVLIAEDQLDCDEIVDVRVDRDRLGLLQFTSGSSGHVRGVQVSVASLEANVNAIRRWTGTTRDDLGASWLPVHHDMGLIGNLLMAMVSGMSWWIMRPEHFIADPMRWLRLYGEHGACLGASPNFGLAYVKRRIKPDDLVGMDFSNWRALVCGAERVDKQTLEEFAALLAPAGFKHRAILPAYGLAEATLAVCGKPLDAVPRSVRVGSRSLVIGAPVEILDGERDDQQWLVACGRPVDERAQITIIDSEGIVLPEQALGEIAVSGPSIAWGYAAGSSEGSSTGFVDDHLLTGDAGFLYEGELYVVGRFGDSLKVRGKAMFAEDVDGVMHKIEGLGTHNSACLLGVLDGCETILAVVEEREGDWVEGLARRLRVLDPEVHILIMSAPSTTIKRTTSGKPRRRPMWDSLVGDRKFVVWDSSKSGNAKTRDGVATVPVRPDAA
jgi:acyl-CoA synthetase (AMP-forming)/AMP-acid ligase II